MCRQAKEIQENWSYQSGDYVYHFKHVNILTTVGIEKFRYTWIPRQDQLQAMISYGSNWVLLNRFNGFVFNILKKYNPDASMEMFWIQFVMFRNYRKSWNGSEWIAEQEER